MTMVILEHASTVQTVELQIARARDRMRDLLDDETP